MLKIFNIFKKIPKEPVAVIKVEKTEPDYPNDGYDYWYVQFLLAYGDSCWCVARSPNILKNWDVRDIRNSILEIDNDISEITVCEPLNEPIGHPAYKNLHFKLENLDEKRDFLINEILLAEVLE